MKIIMTSNGYEVKVDDQFYDTLIKYTWCYNTTKECVQRDFYESGIHYTAKIHKDIMNLAGLYDERQIDHIDNDKLNNQLHNLRFATYSQNSANQKLHSDNTSGYKGVSFLKRINKWRARLKLNGIEHHIGYYDDPKEAALAYDLHARFYFKQFARLNFPKDGEQGI